MSYIRPRISRLQNCSLREAELYVFIQYRILVRNLLRHKLSVHVDSRSVIYLNRIREGRVLTNDIDLDLGCFVRFQADVVINEPVFLAIQLNWSSFLFPNDDLGRPFGFNVKSNEVLIYDVLIPNRRLRREQTVILHDAGYFQFLRRPCSCAINELQIINVTTWSLKLQSFYS
ncbi:hypothetical protein D3C76_1140900 [compost metagenome]